MEASDIVAICAAIIAGLSLIVTVQQGILARRHAKLSVMPHLVFDRLTIRGQRMGLKVDNVGPGPAFVKNSLVRLDDKDAGPTYLDTFFQVAKQAGLGSETAVWGFRKESREAIRAGATIWFVYVDNPVEPQATADALRNATDRIGIVIEYESMYKEQASSFWWNDSNGKRPPKLQALPKTASTPNNRKHTQ
jgi:hypothetical protein